MPRRRPHLLPLLLALAAAACASTASTVPPSGAGELFDNQTAIRMQSAWWEAFTQGDTAYLQAHTAADFSLTLSSGRTYDREATLAQAATHAGGVQMEWADEAVRLTAPDVVIVTARMAERAGGGVHTFRYLTVLHRTAAGWRVAAAQSTREAAFAPRVGADVSGPLAAYAGEYRTPRGTVLRVAVRDSALMLIEPSRAELRMEPIGPGLFEFGALSPANGIVRFAFTRDASGRVAFMTRMIPGQVNTFPRDP